MNIVSWSLACTFWITFIFPEVRGQEEVPSLSTEQRSETVGQDPEPPTVIDLSVESDSRTKAERTESESRQFVVYGGIFSTRAALASLAEKMRAALGRAIGRGDNEWEHPIVIKLRDKDGPIKTAYYEVPGGYRMQIEISLARGKPARLEGALLELV
ncbi:MAG: hypothetical protein MK312_11200, partial [Roseibacillus sp.]|nr:hypothetical protein [Roseibacillus sp.]